MDKGMARVIFSRTIVISGILLKLHAHHWVLIHTILLLAELRQETQYNVFPCMRSNVRQGQLNVVRF